eukprot:47511-Prorocentrum_minimum.AAC.1
MVEPAVKVKVLLSHLITRELGSPVDILYRRRISVSSLNTPACIPTRHNKPQQKSCQSTHRLQVARILSSCEVHEFAGKRMRMLAASVVMYTHRDARIAWETASGHVLCAWSGRAPPDRSASMNTIQPCRILTRPSCMVTFSTRESLLNKYFNKGIPRAAVLHGGPQPGDPGGGSQHRQRPRPLHVIPARPHRRPRRRGAGGRAPHTPSAPFTIPYIQSRVVAIPTQRGYLIYSARAKLRSGTHEPPRNLAGGRGSADAVLWQPLQGEGVPLPKGAGGGGRGQKRMVSTAHGAHTPAPDTNTALLAKSPPRSQNHCPARKITAPRAKSPPRSQNHRPARRISAPLAKSPPRSPDLASRFRRCRCEASNTSAPVDGSMPPGSVGCAWVINGPSASGQPQGLRASGL